MLELRNGQNVIGVVSPGAQFTLPNGDVVSPAYVGWVKGEFSLTEKTVVVPPAPSQEEILANERQHMVLTFAQLLIGLVGEEWISQAEGVAWLSGTPPAAVSALIDQLPSEQRFAAYARAVRPSEVLRLDPLVVSLAAAQGMNDLQTDDFFRTYSVV